MAECKCISQIESKIVGTEQKGGVVKEASLISAGLIGPKFQYRTISEIECKVTIKGIIKKKMVNMIHTYCPFCGKKYED